MALAMIATVKELLANDSGSCKSLKAFLSRKMRIIGLGVFHDFDTNVGA